MPLFFEGDVVLRVRSTEAFEICNEIIASLIAKKECIGWHDGCAAYFGGIEEVHLEPKRRTAASDFGEIGSLAAIANQRRALAMHCSEIPDGSPHLYIACVGADILRVTVDAAFRDIHLPSPFCGSERGRDRSPGTDAIYAEGHEQDRRYQ